MRTRDLLGLWLLLPLGGCLLSDSYDFDGFQYNPSASGAGGVSGTSGQGGAAGDGGSSDGGAAGDSAGEAGQGGDAGIAGDAGASGDAGVSGDGGSGGDAGDGGAGGDAGQGGGAGDAGAGGSDAGAGGSDAGSGGDAGMAGAAGDGGAAGTAGEGGSEQGGAGMSGASGEGGTGGDAGMSGASGEGGGGDAGNAGNSGAAGCASPVFLYKDADGDGYGVSSDSVLGCEASPGWALEKGDCLDSNELVFPGQTTYYPAPYVDAQGSKSYDYDCDGLEKSDPKVTPAPDCNGAACGGKEGYLVSENQGLGVNVLCGSTKLLKCVKNGATCTAQTSLAPTPAACR